MVVNNNLNRDNDVSIELKHNNVFLRRKRNFLRSYVKEGKLLDGVIWIGYSSSFSCPGQFDHILVAVEMSKEER